MNSKNLAHNEDVCVLIEGPNWADYKFYAT